MRRFATGILSAVLATTLAACGGATSDADSQKTATITASILPIVDVAPLYLGEKEGIFDKHGIDLKLSVVQTGAASTASVMSNEAQIGFAAPVPEIQAQDKGLPLQVVGGAISQSDRLQQAVVAPKDSPLEGLSDLGGKTVAVNALRAVNDLVLRAAYEEAGGDPDDVTFVALPYPDMKAALDSKRVDAAYLIEPFLSAALGSGAKVVMENPQLAVVGPGTALSTYFAAKKFMVDNPKTMDRFLDALTEATEYAQAHPDEVRAMIPEFTQMPVEVADKIVLGDYEATVHEETFRVLGDHMVDYGWIKKAPDLAGLIR